METIEIKIIADSLSEAKKQLPKGCDYAVSQITKSLGETEYTFQPHPRKVKYKKCMAKRLEWKGDGYTMMAICNGFSFYAKDSGHLEVWFKQRCIEFHTEFETLDKAKQAAQEWLDSFVQSLIEGGGK